MKTYLFLILSFFTLTASAENWLNHSKIKAGSAEAFSLKETCERVSGEKCFELSSYPSSVYSEVDEEVDDYSKPTYLKMDTENCANDQDCSARFIALVCSENDYSKIKNLDLLQVYCVKLAGYEKKLQKTIALDSQKLQNHEAQEAVKAAIGQKEAGLQIALKKIDCGKRVIALLVLRNVPKGLAPEQVAQMNTVYAPIKGLLETASLVTAKAAILGTTADGLLITEDDKTDLAAETQKCIDL